MPPVASSVKVWGYDNKYWLNVTPDAGFRQVLFLLFGDYTTPLCLSSFDEQQERESPDPIGLPQTCEGELARFARKSSIALPESADKANNRLRDREKCIRKTHEEGMGEKDGLAVEEFEASGDNPTLKNAPDRQRQIRSGVFVCWSTEKSMASLLFLCLVCSIFLLIRQAGKETHLRPESQPGVLIRVVSDHAENDVRMNISACICSCRDWQSRRRGFGTATPMRLCRHLVTYFASHENRLPPSLKTAAPLIAAQAAARDGMPCGPGTEYGHLDKKPYVLYAKKAFLPRVGLLLGSVRYTFDLEENSWKPYPPAKTAYFTLRARQLAAMTEQ